MRQGKDDDGYTLVAILVILALTSTLLAVLGPSFEMHRKREKEAELIRIGRAYATAIQAYYDGAPGNAKVYPAELELLLKDPRYLSTKRYLRRLEKDPLLPGRQFVLVRDARGGVIGVYSESHERPLNQRPMPDLGIMAGAQRYEDWKFIARGAL